ncbi:YdeI/OmpD-associated family protein [Winogradskyella litoriviva]|uniref:YdeI/OmpD-associated family protein n=1 Tax=Winogradskyella litoriviva TaxID=1220182 RepID=A0ABX2E6B8_9FLAO|nr:YdeI/OmpD-associated family protein [Winogradskyella litoriviva]NRD23958.1 YdeI/OmpD-associated family protein [Winogradskyella litoriviva]
MSDLLELYFKTDVEWREWLLNYHDSVNGVHLIFYKVAHKNKSMRWEEAVKVALCFGWIDSTVKSLGDGKRIQYFCPRKPKSVWSAVNKRHIKELHNDNLIHHSGHQSIKIAKENGSWTSLDAVEKGIIPENLQIAFNENKNAYNNYLNFAPSYRKSYLYWLNQAKRKATQQKRIAEIIKLCDANIKSRSNW